MVRTVNPKNGEALATYKTATPQDIQRAITDAHIGQMHWQWLQIKERAKYFLKLAKLLGRKKESLAHDISSEMGKPILQAIMEIEKCSWVCEYYAKNAEKFLKPLKREPGEIRFEPLGCILGIMPWNYPYWQVFRYSAPALMAGNVTICKPAPNTAGCGIKIAELFKEAGFPGGVFQTLVAEPDQLGLLYEDLRIGGVTFTGSERTGRVVAAQAAAGLKPTVLELGGNDPYLIFKDANLELAIRKCVESRLINTGQSCVAAKRFLIHSSLYEKFKKGILKSIKDYPQGDPLDTKTRLGPLAREDLRSQLHSQVRKSIEAGAKPLVGCELPQGPGYYYPASVLEGARPGMPAFDGELFGPVFALTKFSDEEEAVDLANRSRFGLGAAVFSRSRAKALEIASELKVGMVAINTSIASDPRLPFGGMKASGYGRELSEFGLFEFLNIKTVFR